MVAITHSPVSRHPMKKSEVLAIALPTFAGFIGIGAEMMGGRVVGIVCLALGCGGLLIVAAYYVLESRGWTIRFAKLEIGHTPRFGVLWYEHQPHCPIDRTLLTRVPGYPTRIVWFNCPRCKDYLIVDEKGKAISFDEAVRRLDAGDAQ